MKKVLYAIQSTGNGHINRALSIIPELLKKTELDILISGDQGEIELPFEIKYQVKGLTYYFGLKGGIDYVKTIRKMNPIRFIKDVYSLPVSDYDFIISDFEPTSAWAGKLRKIPVVGLSNQAVILDSKIPKPKTKDFLALGVLKHYAPAKYKFGYNYIKFSDNIFTPMIREEIRNAWISDEGHYTVYLPAYSDEKIISFLKNFKHTRWHLFSKNASFNYKSGNVEIFKIDKDKFTKSICSCAGVLCNSGFETTSEALYLGKKMMVIPQKKQYEQLCNEFILKMLGVYSIKDLHPKNIKAVNYWLKSGKFVQLSFPDSAQNVVNRILNIDWEEAMEKQSSRAKRRLVLETE